MRTKFALLILLLCLTAPLRAEVWESSVFFRFDSMVRFDTLNRSISVNNFSEYREGLSFSIPPDIQPVWCLIDPWKHDYCLVSSTTYVIDYLDIYSIMHYDTSESVNVIYHVLDTTQLNFSEALPLNGIFYQPNMDTALYSRYISEEETFFQPSQYLLGKGSYGDEEFFLFRIHAGYYALCRYTKNSWLTCAVQTDGTTRFDSLPQHPPALNIRQESRAIRKSSVEKGNAFGANGARIFDTQRKIWQFRERE